MHFGSMCHPKGDIAHILMTLFSESHKGVDRLAAGNEFPCVSRALKVLFGRASWNMNVSQNSHCNQILSAGWEVARGCHVLVTILVHDLRYIWPGPCTTLRDSHFIGTLPKNNGSKQQQSGRLLSSGEPLCPAREAN